VRRLELREAKANLPAAVDRAVDGEASVITRDGKPVAVVIGFKEWERLSQVPSFGRLLMSAPEGVRAVPKRGKSRLRSVEL
jgi:antitoxin Phd